jgi:hypothetical protein
LEAQAVQELLAMGRPNTHQGAQNSRKKILQNTLFVIRCRNAEGDEVSAYQIKINLQ